MTEFKQTSRSNKLLLGGLGAVLVLVIAAIVLLAITLGKTSNLNAVQVAPSSSPTPQSQPCNQKTVQPYYFTVESSEVSYDNVTNDYAGAASRLKQQIENALNTVAMTRAADGVYNLVLDASGSNYLPVAILGISNTSTGGVSVIASTVFVGTNLPTSQAVSNALNTTGFSAPTVSNGTMSSNSSNMQMCQNVNANPSGGTPPTLPPITTSIPLTTTASTTTLQPSTTSCSVCTCPSQTTALTQSFTVPSSSTSVPTTSTMTSVPSSSTSAPTSPTMTSVPSSSTSAHTTPTMTSVPSSSTSAHTTPTMTSVPSSSTSAHTTPTMTSVPSSSTSAHTTPTMTSVPSSSTSAPTSPTTTPVSTTTTLPPSYPCMRDVLILVDISIGLRTRTNFDDQILFISAALISSGWTVSTLQLEANPVAYDKYTYIPQGSFEYGSAKELKDAVEDMQWFQDAPSIAYGLQKVAKDSILGWRAGVPRVVLLFTSTSDPTDVAQAQQYSDQLKNNNHTIIVVGMGPSANQTILSQLASGTNNTFATDFGVLPTDNFLAAQLNAAICGFVPPPPPSTTITPPSPSSSPTSPATSVSTSTPTSTYPCMRDILILMDNSIGLQNKDNYLYQVMFISLTLINGWTVSPSQVEANPAVYSGNLHNFLQLGSFSFENVDELRHATNAAATLFGANDPPSIKVGLQAATMNKEVNGWRRGVPKVTLLFTSSSDPADVTAALPYAAQLKSNGSSLIVVGMGPHVTASILSPIASGSNFLFTQPYYNVFLNDTTLANQINNAICATPPTTTPGPTTMPTTTPVSTTTTLPPSYPCMRDILILVDVSIGLRSQTNFDDQILFISAALISSGWTVSTLQLEANPVAYEKGNYVPQGSFGYDSAEELKETLETMQWFQDDPSIAYGLKELASDTNLGWRAGVPRVVLLFTSTSDPADVAQAQQYSNQLKNNNHTIIVVGMGPSANQTILSQLASGAGNTFATDFNVLPTDTALAAQLNAAICGFAPPPPPSTTVMPTSSSSIATSTLPSSSTTSVPTSTLPPTTPTMSTVSTTLPSSYPCMRDVLILVDFSIGLRSQTNFDDQLLFISAALISSGWTVSTLQLEANPVAYDKGGYVVQGSFGYDNAQELKEAVEAMQWSQDDAPSIAYGLQEVAKDPNLGWRAGVPRVVLLFTSTSDPTDVAQAQQYSDQLKNSNHTIIVVGMGPSANQTILSSLASGANNTFATDFGVLPTDNFLAAQLNAAICGFIPPPPPSTTVTPPTSSSIATSTLPSSSSTMTASSSNPIPSSSTMTPSSSPSVPSSSIMTPSSSATMSSSSTLTPSSSSLVPSSSSSSTVSSAATQPASSSTSIHSSTSACIPSPTSTPAIPCQGNFVFVIDSSNGMTAAQFRNETAFISSIFGATWTYTEADIAIAQYSDSAFVLDPFGTVTDVDSAQAAVKSADYYGDPASITAALQAASDPNIIFGGQPCVSQTTLLFASTSADADIAFAMPYANQLKAMGSLIIVAMGPNASVIKLQPLATTVLSWPDFSSVPANLNSRIISAMCPT